MKRAAHFVLILALSVAAGIVIGEVALRAIGFYAPVWYKPDPQLGWGLRPGTKGWFTKEGKAYVQVSPAGFRDRTHDVDKPRNTYRIAVMGDSYAEAMQVEFRSTFWWQLQEKLLACAPRGTQVEVMNFGVSGFGTAQEYLMLKNTALRYKPDLVLLAFTNGNDLRNNSWKLESEKDRPFYRVQDGALVLDAAFAQREEYLKRTAPWMEHFREASDKLRIMQAAHQAKNIVAAIRAGGAHANAPAGNGKATGAEPGTDISTFAPPRDAAWQEAWAVTEALVSAMNETTKKAGARFAVTTITHSAQVHPDATVRRNVQDALGVQDLFYIERRLEALGRKQGFGVIPLAPEMQARAEAERVFFHGFRNVGMGVGHWNEEGHRMAADILSRRLCGEAF